METVECVGDVPVCPGCGLVAHIGSRDVCGDCWRRRERRQGGGGLEIVTPAGTIHETPLCPGVRAATEWRYWRAESALYAAMGGDFSKCRRCHHHRSFGLDHYRGADQEVVYV